jgi:hypothetical protein
MLDWKPAIGQVALIEPVAGDTDCLTGVVLREEGNAVVIDLGSSPRPAEPECQVMASFFSPDALYRVDGTLSPHDGSASVIDLTINDVERVQRRSASRAKLTVPVALSNLDDPDPQRAGGGFASVIGETIDIGEGGCRVIVNAHFPSGCDPTVTLHLSEDETLVALAAVLEEQSRPDGRYEYRLVFIEQDDGHRDQLSKFIANAA